MPEGVAPALPVLPHGRPSSGGTSTGAKVKTGALPDAFSSGDDAMTPARAMLIVDPPGATAMSTGSTELRSREVQPAPSPRITATALCMIPPLQPEEPYPPCSVRTSVV